MVPYYVLVFFPMLISTYQNRNHFIIGGDTREDESKGALSAFFLIFLGLLMCRGMSVGADMASYIYYFERIGRLSWKAMLEYGELEKGYVLLNWLLAQVTKNYHHLVVLVSALAVLPIYSFYKREAEKSILTILMFICVAPFAMYFSGLRQILAMAFAFPLWYCAKEKRVPRFVFLLIIAMMMHRSAFVMAVIYPLYHIRITPKWLLVVIPVLVTVYIFKTPILSVLVKMFWNEKGATLENTGATSALLLLILFAIYAFFIPDERKMDTDMISYRNILLFAIAIQCFAPINNIVMRMNYYFLPFVPILIPKVAGRSKRNYYELANLSVIVLCVFFCFYFFWNAYTGADILALYPYVSCWSK